MFRTAITGDIHGDINRFGPPTWRAGQALDKEDVLIILGDFGIPWPQDPKKANDDKLDWLAQQPWTTLVVDGNHDWFKRFNELPTIEKFGNTVGVFRDGVYWLKRGNVYTIQDRTFFVMGGAHSIDRDMRVEGVSWWPEEIPNFQDWNRAADELERVQFHVDFVLTHECPAEVLHVMYPTTEPWDENLLVPRPLQHIAQRLQFNRWYFGHHHKDEDYTANGRNYTCLYEQIRFI